MASEADFRRIAVGMTGAIESSHMGHPDFRAHGRIFATLHHDRQWGMVKLTPEQQQQCMRDHPTMFMPESGAWGRAGCTKVRLDTVEEDVLGEVITLAWQNNVSKAASGRVKAQRPAQTNRRSSKR